MRGESTFRKYSSLAVAMTRVRHTLRFLSDEEYLALDKLIDDLTGRLNPFTFPVSYVEAIADWVKSRLAKDALADDVDLDHLSNIIAMTKAAIYLDKLGLPTMSEELAKVTITEIEMSLDHISELAHKHDLLEHGDRVMIDLGDWPPKFEALLDDLLAIVER
jgi:hypothetical protein